MPISKTVTECLLAPDPVCHFDWISENAWIPDTKETPGPFRVDLFPHVEEPLRELNSRSTRAIVCMWASRLAKTSTGWFGLMSLCTNDPRPAVFAHITEDAADAQIDEDAYPYFRACPPTARLLPKLRKNQPNPKKFISLQKCRIRRASAFAPATLRGYPAAYALATEISGWPEGTTRDANPVGLLLKRGQLYPYQMKYWLESTPGEVDTCQVSALVNAPTTQRRRRMVPCPHCGEFQELTFGDGRPGSPGIKWDKPDSGRPNPVEVEATAWYECAACQERIYNEHRKAMMRAGKWVPEGCTIDRKGKIRGTPEVSASTMVAFAPLSALHSLVITGWGQIAAEFLAADTPGKQREFQQQTLCNPWDPKPKQIDTDDLIERIGVKHAIGFVPSWGVFLTLGIDAQKNCTHFPWCVSAWGNRGRGHAVEFGDSYSFAEVRQQLDRRFPIEGSEGQQLPILLSLIDSSAYTSDIYQFCCTVKQPQLYPCKGSSTQMDKLYRLSKIDDWPGMDLFMVNTEETQTWIQRVLSGSLKPADDGWWTIPQQLSLRPDILDQLVNDTKIVERTKTGRISTRWEKADSHKPNDYRAAARYSRAAAHRLSQHGLLWHQLPSREALYGDALYVTPRATSPAKSVSEVDSERRSRAKPKRRKLRRRKTSR